MTVVFSPFPIQTPDRILCYYTNSTAGMQRAFVTNVPNCLFERVVFPHQRLLFEAVPEAVLEIHSCSSVGNTLLNRIPCVQLKVKESESPVAELSGWDDSVKRTDWMEE